MSDEEHAPPGSSQPPPPPPPPPPAVNDLPVHQSPAAPRGLSQPVRRAGRPALPMGWLAVIGGGLVALGVFLPWVQVPGYGSESGWAAGEWWFLILAGFAVTRGLSMAMPDRFNVQMGTPIIGGVLILVFGFSKMNSVHQQLSAAGVSGGVGIGLYLVLVGGAVVTIGGLLPILAAKQGR